MFDGLSTQFAGFGYAAGRENEETPSQGKTDLGLGIRPNRALWADNFPHAVEDSSSSGGT